MILRCFLFVVFASSIDGNIDIDPELMEFNQKVWADIQMVDEEDALTDDDIRPQNDVEFTDAAFDNSTPWPGAVVPYVLEAIKFDERFLTEFHAAIDQIQSKTCVRFRPRRTQTDPFFVRVIRGDGCWSYVGLQADLAGVGQEISLGTECWRRGIIIHELMHTLGFFHEHSRFDRDDFISLNYANIQTNRIKQFDKREREPVDDMGDYDLYSIMHYEKNAFSLDKKIPTIVPKIQNAKIKEMGQRKALSPLDVAKVNKWYNCSSRGIFQAKKSSFSVSTPQAMHSFKGTQVFDHRASKSSIFASLDDFKIRTGKTALPTGKLPAYLAGSAKVNKTTFSSHLPPGLNPDKIECPRKEAGNCMDRLPDCLRKALDGLCSTKPGYMLRMCRRSCCNCDDSKCFDTSDTLKYNTLCSPASDHGRLGSCETPATRQNAIDYCPKTCGFCRPRS